MPAEVESLNERFSVSSTEEILRWTWDRFGKQAAIGSSFQGAGLVILHIAKTAGFSFPIFTIDTDLLFPETVELKSRLETFLGVSIEVLKPEINLEQQADTYGAELWKKDPDLCCVLRKVVPLRAKLTKLDCWITGLRRQQSSIRAQTDFVELYDIDQPGGQQITKVNPMAAWTREQVWDYLKKNQIPYNPLQDQGYQSIGCKPCTRKSSPGQSERSGRWTGFGKVECGIHTFMAKKK